MLSSTEVQNLTPFTFIVGSTAQHVRQEMGQKSYMVELPTYGKKQQVWGKRPHTSANTMLLKLSPLKR